MFLINIGHNLNYEVQCAAMLFFPGVSFSVTDDFNITKSQQNYILTKLEKVQGFYNLTCQVSINGVFAEDFSSFSDQIPNPDGECERVFAFMMFNLLSPITNSQPSWGILTGVRPVKLFHKRLDNGFSEDDTAREFKQKFLVSDRKIDLALRTCRLEGPILKETNLNEFSLYISIPFCPSRCHYCSFVSQSISSKKAMDLIPDYVNLLCQEIKLCGEIVRQVGLKLSTVYFGGGTPTTLNHHQLDQVCSAVEQSFDLSSCKEYTVEAGRPDTISKEKLLVLKKHNVKRISINPQTMNDEVLKAVGRKHSAKDVIDAFNLAREVGFDCINMDLIAGLPGDSVESFISTIDQIVQLNPENITVHTLSIKRSADYADDKAALENVRSVAQMVEYAQTKLLENGWSPYYLYKQRNTLGNLENVGYTKPGFESRYNIYIMDETHSILACGGGAISKLINRSNGILTRIPNYKYPFEYISKFDEIIKRKEKVRRFFEEDCALPLR